MALVEVNKEESAKGFEKTLDVNSTALILENLQKFQYKYPIDSTVREVVSNAVDSIREKNIAKSILKGQASVEDYYQIEEGEIFQSSKFDSSYYDLKHLSDSDTVNLTYNIGKDRDEFVIKDNGVGLGGSRLEGFFQLAYSSKRLSKVTLGRYGLGAKAPLATGCDSFIMETVYNGRRFKFEIFTHKVDSLVSKWGEVGLNESTEFSNGFKCYYEKTGDLNSVTIKIPVKKHNKSKFIQAVEKQLMYLPENINFVIEEDDRSYPKDFKAHILFETPDIIISRNYYFTRPHIVLNNTVYGFIDFEELELETRYGSVGFKVDIENIDVSPSREEVLWTPRTKAEIIKKYEAVAQTAEEYINSELKDLNYFDWIVKANNLSRNAQEGPLYHLSRICNVSAVSLKWDKDPSKTYALDFNQMWGKSWSVDIITKGYNDRPVRSSTTAVNAFCNNYNKDNVYFKDCNYSGKLVPYLASEGSSLVIMYKRDGVLRDYINGSITSEECIEYIENLPDGAAKSSLEYDLNILNFLMSLNIPKLSSVEVPEDFVTKYSENELETGEIEIIKDTKQAYKDLKAARKANGEITVSLVSGRGAHRSTLKLVNLEVENYCIYGTQEYKDDLIRTAMWSEIPVYMVSKSNVKKFHKQYDISTIKCSSSKDGVITPHLLKINYIKHRVFRNLFYNKSFGNSCDRGYYAIAAKDMAERIDELSPILEFDIVKGEASNAETDGFIKFASLCVTSEMNPEDVFESNQEEIKAFFPGDYKGMYVFTAEELQLFRQFFRFLCTFDNLLKLKFFTRDYSRPEVLETINFFIESKKEEYGYPLTFTYNN